jgi:hypothetical protein
LNAFLHGVKKDRPFDEERFLVHRIFSKRLQNLIILGRVKLHEEPESGPKNLKEVYFQAQIGCFVVLTSIT